MTLANQKGHKQFSEPIKTWDNSPFPSSPKPLHQSEAWCTALHMKMSLICKRMKSHFHIKGWAPRLALWKRFKEIRKWPISYYRYRTGTSLQLRLMWGIFSNVTDIIIFLSNFPHEPPLQASSSPIPNMAYWRVHDTRNSISGPSCRHNYCVVFLKDTLLSQCFSQYPGV